MAIKVDSTAMNRLSLPPAQRWRHAPFSDVEDARRLDEHDLQLEAAAACLREVLQAPVPVVVVKRAEDCRARAQRPPGAPVKRHAHVVLGAEPLGQLHLTGRRGQVRSAEHGGQTRQRDRERRASQQVVKVRSGQQNTAARPGSGTQNDEPVSRW